MISDLDKYGLVALTIVVVLILFIAMNDLQEDSDFDLSGIYFDDSGSDGALPDDVVVVQEFEPAPAAEPPAGEFDFAEDPVVYPGSHPSKRPSPPAAGSDTGRHLVLKGETLSSISRHYYGTPNRWNSIAKANPKVNPKNLKVGQEIVIPSTSRTAAGGEEAEEEALRKYRVKKGDTLGKIAKTFYGSTNRWEKIYAANRSVIKDPKRLKIGAVITIPK